MRLYIAEKASVGRALAGVLPGSKVKGDNCIRCGGDVVAWASGHLLELCEPEDYDEKYKRWGMDTLLYVPEKWRRKAIPRTKALLSGIKKLLRGCDVVVNVGDSDREGQLLIDEILDYCGWAGKTQRLRLNDVNPNAIRKALDNIRDNADFRGEYMAGQARLYADWLVGLALTRYVTVSARNAGYDAKVISVGRVQTPTLGLVVARDREIQDFKSFPYFDIQAELALGGGRSITGRWVGGENYAYALDGQKRLIDREAGGQLLRKLENSSGEITFIEKKAHRIAPPLPFSLSKLQIAASKKFDVTDTLVHVQKLYEAGYVSYPRTSCEYIPEGHFTEAAKIISAVCARFPNISGMLDAIDINKKSSAWDDGKITEHHAIIPTTRAPAAGALSDIGRKIYELICSRYVLQFLPDYEYEETSIKFSVNGETFQRTGRTVVNIGWQGWENSEADKPGEEGNAAVLPAVRNGESGLVRASMEEKLTKPPKTYTYHALISGMNNIYTFIKDPEIRAKLKEVQGIGTSATQETVVAMLLKRGYLEKKKKQLVSTDLGKLLINILSTSRASVMVHPDLTALWERKMSDIECGALTLEAFISEVADMVRGIIADSLEIPDDLPGMAKLHKCLTDG
ncbi:DNA topoisomerase 3 [Synergistales bacterium]|nr:DNA topoisomerase 3 [Synergistales bacterium]